MTGGEGDTIKVIMPLNGMDSINTNSLIKPRTPEYHLKLGRGFYNPKEGRSLTRKFLLSRKGGAGASGQ